MMRHPLMIVVAMCLLAACNGKPDAGRALAKPVGDCARVALAYSGDALTATVVVDGGAPKMVVLACDGGGVCAQAGGGEALGISGAMGRRGACEVVCAGAGLAGMCARVTLPSATNTCLKTAPPVCRKVGP